MPDPWDMRAPGAEEIMRDTLDCEVHLREIAIEAQKIEPLWRMVIALEKIAVLLEKIQEKE